MDVNLKTTALPSVISLSVLMLLSACTVGPDYQQPDLAVASHYARQDAAQTIKPAPQVDQAFWQGFHDPQLSGLVDQALSHNQDIRLALANYQQANAMLGQAKYDLLPTLTTSAQMGTERDSADQMPGVSRDARDFHTYQGSTGFSWELDLFGRVRRAVEAQRAETAASANDLAAMQVAVVGELAQTYFQLRGWQAQLNIARDNESYQARTLALIQSRQAAGMATDFDVDRSRSQLETTRARIPPLEAQVAMAMHRMAVLTGNVPEALMTELDVPAPLAELPTQVALLAPGDLIRRRPDVAAAERRLAAATARIGVATADLFPRFTLGGLMGSQAADAGALFARDSETRSLVLGVDGSFLNVGRVRARLAATNAEAAGNLATYERAVLTSLEETENALVQMSKTEQERHALALASSASIRASDAARIRFEQGAIDQLEWLEAENSRLQSEDALVQGRVRQTLAVVSLYRAMAGGWPEYVNQKSSI